MITFTADSTMLVEDLGAADEAHKRWVLLQSAQRIPASSPLIISIKPHVNIYPMCTHPKVDL